MQSKCSVAEFCFHLGKLSGVLWLERRTPNVFCQVLSFAFEREVMGKELEGFCVLFLPFEWVAGLHLSVKCLATWWVGLNK